MNIPMAHVMIVSILLFTLGCCGLVLQRQNLIKLLISLELILLSVNLNLVGFSYHYQTVLGHCFSFFILTVAAAEAAIGLAIIVVYYRHRQSLDVSSLTHLRGDA